jgi:hypothetical protein
MSRERLIPIAAATWILSTARPISAQPALGDPERRSTLTLDAALGWDSNASFLIAAPKASWLSELTLGVDHARSRPHLKLSFFGNGTATHYGQQRELNHFSFGGGAAATWNPSLQTSVSVTESLTSANTNDVTTLTRAGLVLPRGRVLISMSQAALKTQLSPRTSLETSVAYALASFQSDALVNGSELTSETSFHHGLGPRSSFGVGYRVWESWTEGTIDRAHSMFLDLRRRLGERERAQLQLGIAYVERSHRWPLVGSLGLSKGGRKTTVEIHAARQLGQAFGLGRDRIVDVIDLTFGWQLSRTVSATTLSAYGTSRDLNEPYRTLLKSLSVTTGMTWMLSRVLSAAGNYSYERAALATGVTAASRGIISIRYVVGRR